jgi:hypothetical protein
VSLLEQASADLKAILEDSAGFAVDITVTDPEGNSAALKGLQTDISQTIDPETGMAVVGRKASVALSLDALAAAGLGQPRNIPGRDQKPWVVSFTAPTGGLQTFKVSEAMPDKLGCIVCLLETYKP